MNARLLLLLPFLLVVLAYSPALTGPWLFDDMSNIVANEALDGSFKQSETWRESGLSMPSGPLGRKASAMSFALQSAILGITPTLSKAINLLIHLGCGFLVFLLTKTLFLSRPSYQKFALPAALLASTIWMLSPLQVSTVMYAVQRMAQLSTLFCLLGMLVYAHYRRSWLTVAPSVDAMLACTVWMGVFTIVGAYSKENGALLPWFVTLLEVTWFGGIVAGKKHRVVFALAMFVFIGPVLLALALLTIDPGWIQAGYEARDFSITERIFTQLRLLWLYVFWFLVPIPGQLGLFHDDIVWSTSAFQPVSSALAGVAWLLAILLAVRYAKRQPLLALAVGWWCIGHALESTVLPLEMVFEHRNYLPSIGIAIGLSALLIQINDRYIAGHQRRLLWVVPALLALPLFLRALVWSDESHLADTLCKNHPLSVRSCHFYAQTQVKSAFVSGVIPNSDITADDRALLARHALIKIHERQPEELVTSVALFLLDSHSVPGSSQVSALWMPRIINGLSSNVLDVTEVKAVAQTLQCVRAEVCVASADQLSNLEDALLGHSANFDAGVTELIAHYRDEGMPPGELAELVQEWSKASPTSMGLSDWRALLYLEDENYPAFFDEMLVLAALDKDRRRYPKLSLVISRILSL
ncbi:hypothetical protein R0137_07410 [Congregibacter brevis]|uniref:4-amino-4-deoxy-L-arabinose transferase n=1 Tax=Congregibacter brevis TaxID=3081201 RepID=A0ABZ0IHA1_9GAMM|nr:hypothetical protein R0137_07410 [Congregibacter sp. IMCC45268]